MQHTIQQLFDKVNAMRDMAMVAHRMKYAEPSVDHFDDITHIVENIRQMAGDIYHDNEIHPKVKAKQEDKAWNEVYPPVTENGQDFLTENIK
jgi:uncharacterized protein with LGFP repeats